MTNIAEEEMISRQIELIKKERQVGSAPTLKPYPTTFIKSRCQAPCGWPLKVIPGNLPSDKSRDFLNPRTLEPQPPNLKPQTIKAESKI